MIHGDRFSTGELNVILEVGPGRGERAVENDWSQWNQLKPFQDLPRIGASSILIDDASPKEVDQGRVSAEDQLSISCDRRAKLSTRRLWLQPFRFVITSMKTLTSMKIFNPSISGRWTR